MHHSRQTPRQPLQLALVFIAAALLPALSPIVQADQAPAKAQQAPSPEITSRQEKDQLIEEYRIQGKLYAIKITPSRGEPYMLVDHSGDGNFQMERNLRVAIPEWTLLRW